MELDAATTLREWLEAIKGARVCVKIWAFSLDHEQVLQALLAARSVSRLLAAPLESGIWPRNGSGNASNNVEVS